MTKWRNVICEILDNMAYLLLFYGLLATFLFVYRADARDLRLAWFVTVSFVLNFFIRRITQKLALSIAIHLIMPAVFLLMPIEISYLMWLLAFILSAIFSILYRSSKEPVSPSPFIVTSAILFIALSFWASNRELWPLLTIYPPILTGIVIVRYFLVRMLQMDKSLESVQSTSQMPIKKILQFDYKVSMLLFLLIVGMCTVFYVFFIGPALRTFTEILPGLPQFSPISYETQRNLSYSPVIYGNFHDTMDQMPENSNIFATIIGLMLRSVFSFVAIISVGLFAIFALRAIIRFFGIRSELGKRGRSMSGGVDDEKEFVFPKKNWLNQKKNFLRENEDPVRRKFREMMQKNIKNGVPLIKTDTPTEISTKVAENIENLAEEYSIARYRQ